MFQRLLLAIDDSPSTNVAISFTAALAQRSKAEVHVLYVNEYLVGGTGVARHSRAEAARLVADAVGELQSAGVRVEGTVSVAPCSQVVWRIVETAQHDGADLVVLGSCRTRGLRRLFSRQIGEQVVCHAALPVLTAPAPLKFPPRRLDLVDLLHTEQDRKLTVPH